MSIHRWSKDVLLVDLPGEWKKQNELQTVIRMLREGSGCDVVIDFSGVDMVGGACLADLLRIQRLVNERGHKLTLCGVGPATRGVFTLGCRGSRTIAAGRASPAVRRIRSQRRIIARAIVM